MGSGCWLMGGAHIGLEAHACGLISICGSLHNPPPIAWPDSYRALQRNFLGAGLFAGVSNTRIALILGVPTIAKSVVRVVR